MTSTWRESYMAAILETDWTRMQEKLAAARREIRERQRALSLSHGGTPAERQEIADALHRITNLQMEAGDWQRRQIPQRDFLES